VGGYCWLELGFVECESELKLDRSRWIVIVWVGLKSELPDNLIYAQL
jgi:hypothetical protein